MYCRNCGTLLPDKAKFCQSCGTQVTVISKKTVGMDRYPDPEIGNAAQDKNKPHKKKGIIAAAIAVVLVLCVGVLGYMGLRHFLLDSATSQELSSKATAGVITGDSPEEIVEIFMDAFAKQDIETMLACCYVDEMVERYSFADFIDRIKAYFPNYTVSISDSQFYKELALYEQKGTFARNIRYLTWSILLAEDEEDHDILDYMTKGDLDYDWAVEFESKIDPEKIYGFRILRIDENNPEKQHTDGNIERNRRNSEIYGVDDICERTILFECNGMLFYKGFTLVQYDGQWQIQFFNAAILGDPSLGNASRIESVDAYMEIIE